MSVKGSLGAAPASGAIEMDPQVRHDGRAIARGVDAGLGLLGILILIVSALVIAVAAGNSDTLLPESVHPIPAWLAGPFGITGPTLGPWAVSVVLSAMFGGYLITLRYADRLSGRQVLAAVAALNALLLLAPPLLSTDVFSYQAYGRIGAVYGSNPYLTGPHAIALDPLYPFVGAKWVTTPTVYGPLFTVLSYPIALLGIAGSVLAYKAIAAISSVAIVAIVWNSARLRGLDPVRAAAFVGLNPLLIVFGVGGGHNDLLMLAALALGVHLVLLQRDRAGASSIVLAAGVKLTAGLVLPFALAGRIGSQARARRELIIGTSIVGAGMTGAALALFGTGPLHLLSTLQKTQAAAGNCCSVPGTTASLLGFHGVSRPVGLGLAVVFLIAFAWLIRRVAQSRLDWIAGAGWATVALLVTATSVLAWYIAWLLPFAALGADARLRRAALAITGLVLLVQLAGFFPGTGL